jgi:hypothetical protein
MKIHETQEAGRPGAEHVPLTAFENAQRIEGGRPLQRVEWRQLPAPIRFFGYFIRTVMLIMLLFSIIMLLN